MLKYNPNERITAAEALLHPFFDELIDISKTIYINLFDFK